MPKFPIHGCVPFSKYNGFLMRSSWFQTLTCRTLRIFLAALSIAVLFFPALSLKAQMPEPAPFGLTWGMSVEELVALGVDVRPLFSNGVENRVSVKKLPKMLRDMDEAILSFGTDDRLNRIDSRSKEFHHDLDGARLKARYNALYRVLSQKYGKGEQHHDISVTWRKPTDFLMGLYRGASVYYTSFTNKNVRIRLELRATRRFAGHYRLIFEYASNSRQDKGESKEKDVL